MDQFMEEVVVRRNRSVENLVYAMSWVSMILFGAGALFMFNVLLMTISTQGFSADMLFGIVLAVVLLGSCVLLFFNKDKARTEYEYTFTNGILDFAKVMNNRKRKALGTMQVRNVEAMGMVSSGSFRRYLQMPGVKRINWFLNRDAELFYLFFQKDGVKSLMVIEPSPTMRDLIIRAAGQGKYQQN